MTPPAPGWTTCAPSRLGYLLMQGLCANRVHNLARRRMPAKARLSPAPPAFCPCLCGGRDVVPDYHDLRRDALLQHALLRARDWLSPLPSDRYVSAPCARGQSAAC